MIANEVLIYPEPLHSITKDSKNDFINSLQEKLKGRADSAYIFGSFLTDKFDAQSDLDLIIITNTEKSFFDRAADFSDIQDLDIPVDLLVYTPAEFQKQLASADDSPGFWRSVKESMQRIL